MADPSSPPSSLRRTMKGGGYSNWAELPSELTSSILGRLGTLDILEIEKVCSSWRSVCKNPSLWKTIDMHNVKDSRFSNYGLEAMCRHAVGRSQGGLLEIDIWYFCNDELLNYIAERSSNLRSLKLAMCNPLSGEGFAEAVVKLPLLEDLEVSYCSVSEESLKAVGKSCPNLRTLNLNGYWNGDGDALAIAATMPGLRHLQLFGNRLTNAGLITILDNCPNLEHLDVRHCFNLNLVGNLEKRCFERIKVVRRPNASIYDYPFDAMVYETDTSEEDDDYAHCCCYNC